MKISYDKLWNVLKERGINRSDLAQELGISRNTISRMGKCEPVYLTVLIRIGDKLNLKVDDMFERIED